MVILNCICHTLNYVCFKPFLTDNASQQRYDRRFTALWNWKQVIKNRDEGFVGLNSVAQLCIKLGNVFLLCGVGSNSFIVQAQLLPARQALPLARLQALLLRVQVLLPVPAPEAAQSRLMQSPGKQSIFLCCCLMAARIQHR